MIVRAVEGGAARLPAPLLAILAIAFIQVGAAIAKGLFPVLGPAGTVFLRVAFSALILGALYRPRPFAAQGSDLVAAAGLGLALGGMNLSFYAALDRIPLGVAVTLEFIGPLGLAIAGSRRRLDVLWAVLAGAGILLLARGDVRLDPLGIAFALVAGGLWAAYILLTARVGRAFSGGDGLAIALAVAAVLLIPVGVVSAGGRLFEPRLLALGLAVALLSSTIPYSLEMASLRRLPARVFGVLMSLEPALGALVGAAALGEVLGPREVLAIGLVVAASFGATLTHKEAG
ncbi:MAG: EamA family transporter [Chloroflexi bacterium]|nr:EamA family transporter [Chloroflexota bacterium]